MATIYVGLMSGTSADGINAVAVALEGGAAPRLLHALATPYPPELRRRLIQVATMQPALTLIEFAELDRAVGECHAQAVDALLRRAALQLGDVRAIGSHGQTVFHQPDRSSLQLGDPNLIAARTGITVVADFRRADLALGGQGAPLVPRFHHAVFADADEPRCVLNLGGIANVTLLPDTAAAHVTGFDTGPANALMDEWAQQAWGQAMDRDGTLAARGTVVEELMDVLLADRYFAQPPPKSTGRDYFNLAWCQARFPGLRKLAAPDVMATLCELTARSVADALRRQAPHTRRLLVCGGGARNHTLMGRLAASTGIATESTTGHGLEPEWVEACAFAWLAMRTLDGLPGNLPAVTGASREAVLGGIYKT